MSGHDFDGPEAYRETVRKARKEHRCYACGETIRRGDRYRYTSGVWDGRGESFRHCLQCAAILSHLTDMGAEPLLNLNCGHEYSEAFDVSPPRWLRNMVSEGDPGKLQALWALETGLQRLCQGRAA